MNVRLVSAAVLAALAVATASPERGASSGGCGQGAVGAASYAYAGYQAASSAHGVRATITPLSIPNVGAGHVAAWIGVGGPDSGAGGTDSWLQAGVAALPGEEPFVYAEVVHPDRSPELKTIASNVAAGRAHRVAVLEIKQRPGWWRVWVDGSVVVEAIRLLGTAGGWMPIATAESWNRQPRHVQLLRVSLPGHRACRCTRRLMAPIRAGASVPEPRLPAATARAVVVERAHRRVVRVRAIKPLARLSRAIPSGCR